MADEEEPSPALVASFPEEWGTCPTKNDRVNGRCSKFCLCLLFLPITCAGILSFIYFNFYRQSNIKRRNGTGTDGGNADRRAVKFNLPSYERQRKFFFCSDWYGHH